MPRKPKPADPNKPKGKNGGARPGSGRKPTPIDPGIIENLCAIGATIDEMAAVIGLHRDSFKERVAKSFELQDAIERGRAKGKLTLRRLQWDYAKKGNGTMLVWLGKQMLGQRDKHDIKVEDSAPPPDFSMLSTEELAVVREAARLMRKAQAAPVLIEQRPEADSESDDQAA